MSPLDAACRRLAPAALVTPVGGRRPARRRRRAGDRAHARAPARDRHRRRRRSLDRARLARRPRPRGARPRPVDAAAQLAPARRERRRRRASRAARASRRRRDAAPAPRAQGRRLAAGALFAFLAGHLGVGRAGARRRASWPAPPSRTASSSSPPGPSAAASTCRAGRRRWRRASSASSASTAATRARRPWPGSSATTSCRPARASASSPSASTPAQPLPAALYFERDGRLGRLDVVPTIAAPATGPAATGHVRAMLDRIEAPRDTLGAFRRICRPRYEGQDTLTGLPGPRRRGLRPRAARGRRHAPRLGLAARPAVARRARHPQEPRQPLRATAPQSWNLLPRPDLNRGLRRQPALSPASSTSAR